ncbi:MAG: DNA mismatch repair protein MutS [Spirochaetia bacterium]|nr:DNA mismatch repair protein MutS [Spirochaetota bacterium]MDW8113144.1 DNA mismatch repair protein MutS [Spirochaetia bacterium]
MSDDKDVLFEAPKVSTPMIRQYQAIKAKHKDKLLLFRLGDFYELFGDDAYEASRVLSLVLTSRNELPMCGFPAHASSNYIYKLVRYGYKVAICEQLEDPTLAKGIVRRGVVQIITPGTITDEEALESKSNNFLITIHSIGNSLFAALGDVSTGEILIERVALSKNIEKLSSEEEIYSLKKELKELFTKYKPSELLISNTLLSNQLIHSLVLEFKNLTITSYPDWFFNQEECVRIFDKHSRGVSLDRAIGNDEKSVMGALLRYFEETQMSSEVGISSISFIDNRKYMEMDEFTIRNLEIVSNLLDGSKKYTLLEVMDKTVTPMGGRLLRKMLLNPSIDLNVIRNNLDKTEFFFKNYTRLGEIRKMLSEIVDIERISNKILFRRATPKDLVNLKSSLRSFNSLIDELKDYMSTFAIEIPKNYMEIYNIINSAILDEPSNVVGEGNVIRDGVSQELDEMREISRNTKEYIEKIQERERLRTGIQSLKVGYNKVMGFYIEVSKPNLHLVPKDYERKQTLVSAERFTTNELKELEYKVLNASERIEMLEKEIFQHILGEVSKYYTELKRVSNVVSDIDVFSSLGLLAVENDYCKPEFVNTDEFVVKMGRHPVVEAYLPKGEFIPNDTYLNNTDSRIIILTGPNMAGKSTYLRQNALIAIMAHIGSFVPARECRLGVIDKIFTRIGASDFLALGQSTFLVEMIEVANILKNATPRSLIVMDEVGRGTSTYDGVSIAWAVIDYIANNPQKYGKTLFATHYHELTKLGDDEKRGIKNYTMAVREYKDEVVFLKKVVKGVASKSYGIFVAKIAGISDEIINKANEILSYLENTQRLVKEKVSKEIGSSIQPPLFMFDIPENLKQVSEYLKRVDIFSITPIEALKILEELKSKIGN